MKVVYIAHPLGSGSDREANRRSAAKWVAWAGSIGVAPVADWIILSGEWDESRREQGLTIDFALIKRCDEVWLCGSRISPGMIAEARHAQAAGIPVYDRTYEPPDASNEHFVRYARWSE
jgi:hypothetical protein